MLTKLMKWMLSDKKTISEPPVGGPLKFLFDFARSTMVQDTSFHRFLCFAYSSRGYSTRKYEVSFACLGSEIPHIDEVFIQAFAAAGGEFSSFELKMGKDGKFYLCILFRCEGLEKDEKTFLVKKLVQSTPLRRKKSSVRGAASRVLSSPSDGSMTGPSTSTMLVPRMSGPSSSLQMERKVVSKSTMKSSVRGAVPRGLSSPSGSD